ncbi:hypothetical protein MNBD_GAMMA08-1763 [hydrothermal vent metagenome]|uniref:Uncharacterized protein n=1 Tax=hydrothermal vent metagenome TaxID=652676 RepID=A0A3B0Y0X5_9ZZZZ
MFNKNELNQLYRYALSLCRQEETAYDLVHGAIERYLYKTSSAVDKPLAYLKTTIRNLYFDLQRHEKIVPMVSMESEAVAHIEPITDDLSMESALINQQQALHLISCLNADESELLYLWAVEEYTVEEIASLYEKPKGTMLSKLHRLKKRIREQIQRENTANPVTNVANK